MEELIIIYGFPYYRVSKRPFPSSKELAEMLMKCPFEMNSYLTPKAMGDLEYWCERVRTLVSAPRFLHIIRVAHLSYHIAKANRLDAERAFLAGLLHDLVRDLPEEKLLQLAPAECELDRTHPLAVHGRAGRALLENWGFKDRIVLEAIEDHTTGPRAHNFVSKIVYIADVSEPGRKVNDDIRDLAFTDLELAFQLSVCSKVEYLTHKGVQVHPRTLKVHDGIKKSQPPLCVEE